MKNQTVLNTYCLDVSTSAAQNLSDPGQKHQNCTFFKHVILMLLTIQYVNGPTGFQHTVLAKSHVQAVSCHRIHKMSILKPMNRVLAVRVWKRWGSAETPSWLECCCLRVERTVLLMVSQSDLWPVRSASTEPCPLLEPTSRVTTDTS